MKKILNQMIKVLPFLLAILAVIQVNAQTRYAPYGASDFTFTIANDVQTSPTTMEFDLYLLDTDPTESFELASVQAGIIVNSGIYNGGTITISQVPGQSQLVTGQQPTSILWVQATNAIKVIPKAPPGAGLGTIISQTVPGTKVCRIKITNTVPFTANSTANLTFNFTTTPYPTKVAQYIGGLNTQLACSATNCFSNAANIVLNAASTAPVAFAVTGGGAYCQGGAGLPVGLANSEVGVNYQLFKDAVASGATVPGTGAAISFSNQTAGTYTVTGTNAGGTTLMTGSAVITETTPLPVSVSIAANANNVCAGTSVTFTATPVNGGTAVYQWFKNGSPAGTNLATYSYTPANGDQVYVIVTSSLTCVTGNPATSNTVTLTVNTTLPVSVSIATDANNVCAGTSVTFTATPVNGGTAAYQWYKNGSTTGTNLATYSYVPVNGDQVHVIVTSSLTCVTGNPATSNTVTMVVSTALTPAVSIAASANPVTAGTSVTFTPTPVNGGSPTYQWFVNGVSVSTGATYAYVPANGDAIYVVMTSTLICVTSTTATSNTVTMTVTPADPATSTWTGATNTNWFTASNWNNGVPGAITVVTIPHVITNYPTLISAATVASITIESGASFIGAEFLTVANALVKQDFPLTGYHYISSPVQSTTFTNVFPLNQDAVWAYVYDEPSGNWINQTIASTLGVGTGYSVKMDVTQTALFAGQLNKLASYTQNLSNQNSSGVANRVGWNLLGNPYQSAISWDAVTKGAGVDGAVYVWNGSQYISYAGGSGGLTGGIIPAINGFFVKANANGANVTIPLAARVHSAQNFYKSSFVNLLSLRADGNSYTDEAFVHFNESATSGFDNQYDAYKLFGIDAAPQLYSMITGDILNINALPMQGNEVVNMGFKCSVSGNYSVTASGIESFDATTPILLEDIKTNTVQDLRLNPVYSFSFATGDAENRFKLHFKLFLSVPERDLSGINIYSVLHTVVINNATNLAGEVKIYDLTGRELLHTSMSSQNETRIPVQVAVGTYLVKVITAKGVASNKVFIR